MQEMGLRLLLMDGEILDEVFVEEAVRQLVDLFVRI